MTKTTPKKRKSTIPVFTLIIGLLVLAGLIYFVIQHIGDTRKLIELIRKAKPAWLLVIVGLQVCTYLSVGVIWYLITQSASYVVSLRELTRLSVEKLSIDQLLPAVGVSGNMVVYRSMKRLGIPKALAMEAILINILAHYIAYALVAIAAVIILSDYHNIPDYLLYLLGLFVLILVSVPMVILGLIARKEHKLPNWLIKIGMIKHLHEVIKSVSRKRVYSFRLLSLSSLFNLLIFFLDSATLWTCLHAFGLSVPAWTPFVALVMASIAATLSLLPGGLGGFEAGSVMALHWMGVPLEAALAGTLLLRGFTLWLPLIPGLVFARKDITRKQGAH